MASLTTLRFPSKTWLLGEYAVLKGAPGLMLGHGPYFAAELTPSSAAGPSHPFHPESPAGRWLSAHPIRRQLNFIDPHAGAGGFGGSGAEYLSAWFAEKPLPTDANERAEAAHLAWNDARIFPGSGADILTQAYGVNTNRPFLLSLDMKQGRGTPLSLNLGATISLFRTGMKINTHDHIAKVTDLPAAALSALVSQGEAAIADRDLPRLAGAINDYGRVLAAAGFLAQHSARALANLPKAGVLAAKGCGAMGADVLLVLHEGVDLSTYARENSLAEVARLPV